MQMEEKNKLDINPHERVIDLPRWVMYVPDPMLGHEEVEWTPDDDKSKERAKKMFEDKLKAGWAAFKEVVKDGVKKWEKIDHFDSRYTKVLLLPLTKQLAAGG
jgi:hypothetical protein